MAANAAVSTPQNQAWLEVTEQAFAAAHHLILEMIVQLQASLEVWPALLSWPLAESVAGALGGVRSLTKAMRGSQATGLTSAPHRNQRSLSMKSHMKLDNLILGGTGPLCRSLKKNGDKGFE
jgi:hypothetical protein